MIRGLRYRLNRKKVAGTAYNPRMSEVAKKLSDLSLTLDKFIIEYEDVLLSSQKAYDLVDQAAANLVEAQSMIETGKPGEGSV